MTEMPSINNSSDINRLINRLAAVSFGAYLFAIGVSLLVFYVIFFRSAFVLGHLPVYGDPGVEKKMLAERMFEITAELIPRMFPVYVLAHIILWRNNMVARSTSWAVVCIQLFWLWSIIFSPIGEWYFD